MYKKKNQYYENSRQEMLQFIPKEARNILEVGCGAANFSTQLVGENTEVWGVEPNEKSASEASEKLNKVLVGTLDDVLSDIPDGFFDAIVLNDVLEHLLKPWEDLNKLKSKLSKKGVVVTSIPNVRYSKNIFRFLFKRDWKYTEDNILDITHYRFFTKKSVKRLYQENGFQIQKIKGINVTKSVAFFPFAVLFNILFLFSQTDMFYMQYATVASVRE